MAVTTTDKLTDTVGAEVVGIDRDRLLTDDELPGKIMAALEANGVLVFRGLHMDPETQVAFCERLGEVDKSSTYYLVPGIYRVTLDTEKNPTAEYLRGTFDWHIDGCTPTNDEPPIKATLLTAHEVAGEGGETEFASTYAAYDDLTEEEKERFDSLRVFHSLEASQRRVTPDPTPKQLAVWRSRGGKEHPLVWKHRTGRSSLVIGGTTDHVVGMSEDESQKLLDDLLDRATRPERVYRHEWTVGDTVMWDNRGVLHRAAPYDPASPRDMLRTTLLGDEQIQ